ncbi:chemotaxis protein CheW [Acidovorax sp.]|uniref:chemotaxis protein CheW n=1 Tax=Acidovorax sp. TaxID=1872122 RepID=UPI002ACD6B5F|nr:chemotaxis protein CheW [Acidovorax sp.]MDZ7865804.1 chemotaxis protein CheW [Acidovorax sp.]
MSHSLNSPEQWLRYMPAAQHQRQELRLVETAWDQLALLSSLSLLSSKASSGGDLAQARRDFAALASDLMQGLVSEALKNRTEDLAARAQVCIDVLVRNLFERTADIGFFATDVGVAEYLADPDPSLRPLIEARLAEYASKYTVYGNIFLFDTDLQPCASLRAVSPVGGLDQVDADAVFLRSVLQSDAGYVEHHAVHGFCGTPAQTLVYARRVHSGGRIVGVLCLEFKLADEMPAIFDSVQQGDAQGLLQGSDAVLALVDASGRVLVSGDPLQLPAGWLLPQAGSAGVYPLGHASRRYLMAVRDTQGFQGYQGPGWRGVALLPLDIAFDEASHDERSALANELSGQAQLLSQELRDIPRRSAAIQSALERSVWNGLLELNQIGDAGDAVGGGRDAAAPRELLFAKTLLSEIGATARKTAQAFASALQDLYSVVLRSLLRDAQGRAALAMQILDRNLYERANDCRWWALTPQFARTLAAGTQGCSQATAVLAEINSLYTVYACLVLFGTDGRVVAVSQPGQAHQVGTRLDEDWAQRCLRLQGSQAYTVSRYETSRFYSEGPTFVYAAAVRADVGDGMGGSAGGPVLGGIAIVWDAAHQLQSILDDCAVGTGARDTLAFVDAQDRLVRASGDAAVLQAPEAIATSRQGGRTAALGGHLYGMGQARGQGYREFRTSDGYEHGLGCLVLRHLCERRPATPAAPMVDAHAGAARVDAAHRVQMATFLIGSHWLGVEAAQVVTAAPDVAVLHGGGSRHPFLGLAQIGERVYSVVDLRSVVAAGPGDAPVLRAADPNRQMVLVRVPLEGGSTREFVLRVDALGAMLDLDRRELRPVGMAAGPAGTPLIDAVIPVPSAGGKPAPGLLCRISPQWLLQCALGALTDGPAHDVDALVAAA